ncbi:hypothetical protein L596_010711 [Steinernema carpocapsae]|uniref:Uncharacterized protein n=1 Tax=Steinernema carpocapsae TaxID=34508 RepID=A0A4U5PJN2_STECR|nr:hypothetical protein L596_010711 [Steinernema carpocapsae]
MSRQNTNPQTLRLQNKYKKSQHGDKIRPLNALQTLLPKQAKTGGTKMRSVTLQGTLASILACQNRP